MIEEIERIVNRKERENNKVELKSFAKLLEKPNEGGDDTIFGIVAFANTFGGRMIFGIDKNGNFEGKYTGDIDRVKGNLYSLTRDKISPSLEIQVTLIESANWDVIVVEIPKKKSMPHAFIEKRTTHEIRNRIYYKRTRHGKKLVTDSELHLLFSEAESGELEKEYRLAAEFNKSFQLESIGSFITREAYRFNFFLDRIEPEVKQRLLENNEAFKLLIFEIYPYAFISMFTMYYRNSWNINIWDGFDRSGSGPVNTDSFGNEVVEIKDIETEGFNLLKKSMIDFDKSIQDIGMITNRSFVLPEGSKIKFNCSEDKSVIEVQNKLFNYQIAFYSLSNGRGIHQKNPLFQDSFGKGTDMYNHFRNNYHYFDGGCVLNFKINYEMTSFQQYLDLKNYFKSLDILITRNWDINEIIRNLPSREIREISNNVNEILNCIKRKQD